MFAAREGGGDRRKGLVLFGLVDGTLYLFALLGRKTGNVLGAADDALTTTLFAVLWASAMLLPALFLVDRRRVAARAQVSPRPTGRPRSRIAAAPWPPRARCRSARPRSWPTTPAAAAPPT